MKVYWKTNKSFVIVYSSDVEETVVKGPVEDIVIVEGILESVKLGF